jgi:hypothetical protein
MMAVEPTLISFHPFAHVRGIKWNRSFTHVPRNIVWITVNAGDAVERELVVRGEALECLHGPNEQRELQRCLIVALGLIVPALDVSTRRNRIIGIDGNWGDWERV